MRYLQCFYYREFLSGQYERCGIWFCGLDFALSTPSLAFDFILCPIFYWFDVRRSFFIISYLPPFFIKSCINHFDLVWSQMIMMNWYFLANKSRKLLNEYCFFKMKSKKRSTIQTKNLLHQRTMWPRWHWWKKSSISVTRLRFCIAINCQNESK